MATGILINSKITVGFLQCCISHFHEYHIHSCWFIKIIAALIKTGHLFQSDPVI